METFRSTRPIVAIVGQTASGKSDLAMEIARNFNGEILAADSRTVYKGMDIGTAKPTADEQKQIQHYGLDLIDPDEKFSAAEFKKYANNVVNIITGKNKLPVLVGGTGLYIDGLLYDFEFAPKPENELREQLAKMDLEDLQKRARGAGLGPEDVNYLNKRHLQRAIERSGYAPKREHKLAPNVLLIGLRVNKDQLDRRIAERVDTMFNNGLVSEVEKLVNACGEDAPGLLAPGYKAVIEHLNGRLTEEAAREHFIRNDRRLAKRQLTWFKRNSEIRWCSNKEDALVLVRDFISKYG